MQDPVPIPRDLLARLMAAIETPDDLTEIDRLFLLVEAEEYYPHEMEV